jgi:hypothetical protein
MGSEQQPSTLAQPVTLQNCIQEITVLNLSRKTDHSEILWFSLAPQAVVMP